jgi:putative thioredoxin
MSVDTPILKDGGAQADLIKNTTTKDFMRDVVEASREVPVLVDFWAPWCGPCRQLTPVLEKAVRAAKGAVRLVKLNIDEHPQIPGQMGVQSIPAVFAFQDGRPVDGFMGALPESRVNAFIARLIGDAAGDTAAELEAAETTLAAGDVNTAAQAFGEVLQTDRENAQALAGLAKCYLKTGDLALALNAKGDRGAALEELLTLVAKNRAWNDDAARKQLVQLFDAWGGSDPATIAGRQRLSSLLFA